jgi:hypothetical protein
LIIACKKLADLTNDDALRRKLYVAEDQQKKQRIFHTKPESRKLLDFIHSHPPTFPRALVGEEPQLAQPELYNDQPPGRGFVMKR